MSRCIVLLCLAVPPAGMPWPPAAAGAAGPGRPHWPVTHRQYVPTAAGTDGSVFLADGRGSLNAYGYCGGDPVNGADPSGLAVVSALGAIMDMAGNALLMAGPQMYTLGEVLRAQDEENPFLGSSAAAIGLGIAYKTAASLLTYADVARSTLPPGARAPGFGWISGGPKSEVAQVTANRISHAQAVDDFIANAQASGLQVAGREVTVRTPFGPRRYDVVLRDSSGALHSVEIKSSAGALKRFDAPARRQVSADRWVNQSGADAIGQNASLRRIQSSSRLLWRGRTP